MLGTSKKEPLSSEKKTPEQGQKFIHTFRPIRLENFICATIQQKLVRCSLTDRNKEDATEQGASERRFNELFVTFVAEAMTLQQGSDVEGHLCDGAECGVHYSSHCEVALSRDTEI